MPAVLAHEHHRQRVAVAVLVFGKNDSVGILSNLFPFTVAFGTTSICIAVPSAMWLANMISGMRLSDRLERVCVSVWRPGQRSDHDTRLDLYWLLGLGLLLIGVGIGLRDPGRLMNRALRWWRDMVLSGQWLIPMIGGDTYADKPPLFFWLIGFFYLLTGSLRIAFLLPSLLAGLATLALIYDLGRRLWNREVGLAAALLLLGTVQFVWQARQAQIDATVCFWIVLGLYGLIRHLLLGPAWRWYYLGCAAAGFGIITRAWAFCPC
jgi:hypothetical protein